jgi:hypothetical protein
MTAELEAEEAKESSAAAASFSFSGEGVVFVRQGFSCKKQPPLSLVPRPLLYGVTHDLDALFLKCM